MDAVDMSDAGLLADLVDIGWLHTEHGGCTQSVRRLRGLLSCTLLDSTGFFSPDSWNLPCSQAWMLSPGGL